MFFILIQFNFFNIFLPMLEEFKFRTLNIEHQTSNLEQKTPPNGLLSCVDC